MRENLLFKAIYLAFTAFCRLPRQMPLFATLISISKHGRFRADTGFEGPILCCSFSGVEIAAVAAAPRVPTSTLGRLNQPAKIPETTELRRGEPRCGTENCA